MPPSQQRLLSLDVLRGLTVAVMILVNNAGNGAVSYPQLRHSVWNGCTLTDVVFPLFLFIVGASISFAFRSRLARGASRRAIFLQVLKRAALIFALGLLLNAAPTFHLADLRVYGVLQRIALCYAIAAAIYLAGGIRTALAVAILALTAYWLLLTRFPVPGFGHPGVDVPVLDPHGNLTAWLDRALVPTAHLYRHTFYDPEGLLGTISALANTLFGILAGAWLQSAYSARRKVVALLTAGLLFAGAALLWSNVLPFNKRLWTSSFALFTSGIAMALLALLFWAIDKPGLSIERPKPRPMLTPWLVFGTNALTAYVLSEVLAIVLAAIPAGHGQNLQKLLFHLLPTWLGPPPLVSMLYSVLFVAVCFLPVYELYRRRIFLKL